MNKYVIPILTRYASVIVQFAVIAVITRVLTREDAGQYFVLMGIVLATYFLAGIGLPDGIVRAVPALSVAGDTGQAQSALHRGFHLSIATLPPCAIVIFGAALLYTGSYSTAALTACWWTAYGSIFIAAQVVVANGQAQLGTAVFYSAANTGQIAITVPIVVFGHLHSLDSILAAAALGTAVAAFASLIYAWRVSRTNAREDWPLGDTWRQGATIAAGRVVQACFLWSPVWLASLAFGAADAAVVGLACRLVSAVAAVLAAVRFSIRPALARTAALGDWESIERQASRIAFYATALASIAILVVIAAGDSLIGMVFGTDYRGAGTLTALLLIGTLGECLGGPVDEVLRMSGHAGDVTLLQVAMLIISVIAQTTVGHLFGINQFALAYAFTFALLYIFYILRLRQLRGITVLPRLSGRRI